MREWAYIAGDPWIYCDVCGFKTRRSQTLKRWDGAVVCTKDWEPRHPQDRIKARSERQVINDPRPEPEHRFLGTNEVSPEDL